MPEAIIFSDVHVSEFAPSTAEGLKRFLADVCPTARRVYILGDLFDFWFGPAQARIEPFAGVLDSLAQLVRSGTEVVFYHGNRDFYFSRALAAQLGIRLVEDYSVEEICGKRALLCHGDMLCTNDRSYHRMRRIVRNPLVRSILTRMPAPLARQLARIYRARSKRAVAAKPQWVLGINDDAVRQRLAGDAADAIICGHTHRGQVRSVDAPGGPRPLYTLPDFGKDAVYLECGCDGFFFRSASAPL